MNSVFELLSGEVPGGFLLLILILFIINLSLFFFYKGSKFFSKEVYQKKTIRSNLIIIIIYITLWIVLKPIPLPDSILFVPMQNGEKCDYMMSEILETHLSDNLSEEYRLHDWEWFYQTCNRDSINNFDYRFSVARRLNVDLIVTGTILDKSNIKINALSSNLNFSQNFELEQKNTVSEKILNWLNSKYEIFKTNDFQYKVIVENEIQKITKAKILYYDGKFSEALTIIENLEPEPSILKSEILLEFGKKELPNHNVSEFEKKQNKYFALVQNLLITIAKEGNDNAELNRILGRMYLFEDKYKEAEIFLKKALTQNPYDSRIYNDLYYLHYDRYKDLGFNNRFEVLKKAIELDKGYVEAVLNLANDYFQTGTGIKTGTGTTFALQTLNDYMKINSENDKILNLLASINLQIKHTDEAIEIYNKLIAKDNKNSQLYYNLGIGYFHKKNYKKAETAFLKSIEIDEYPDSFLYVGAINKIIGNFEKALYYYRERIKRRKKRQDDYYATEALHGLQWILKKQYEDSVNNNLKE